MTRDDMEQRIMRIRPTFQHGGEDYININIEADLIRKGAFEIIYL